MISRLLDSSYSKIDGMSELAKGAQYLTSFSVLDGFRHSQASPDENQNQDGPKMDHIDLPSHSPLITSYFERRRRRVQSEKTARLEAEKLALLNQQRELRELLDLRVFEFTSQISEARKKFHL